MRASGLSSAWLKRRSPWLLCILLLVGLPQVAAAHPVVKRSVPAAGDTLRQSLRELTLVFDESIQLSLSSIELVGPGGQPELIGPLRRAGMAGVTAAIVGVLAEGAYEVRWRTAGADGHPVNGRYGFVVAPSARVNYPALPPMVDPHPAEAFPQQVQQFGVESTGYVAIRAITYALLITLIGVVGFQVIVLARARRLLGPDGTAFFRLAMAQADTVGAAAAGGLVLAGLARLTAQVFALTDPGAVADWDLVAAALSGGPWASGMYLQLGGGLLALGGFRLASRQAAGARFAAYLTVGALTFVPAWSGHAAAVDGFGGVPVVSDALHVLGAGGWLGTLLVILLVGVRRAVRTDAVHAGHAVGALVKAFSPAALVFASLTVVTGVFAAWLHLGSFTALWSSGYGRTLLLKLAAVSLVASTGAYNWRRVRPALGTHPAIRRFTISATAELIAAAAVVVITAVLVATPPPSDP